jgi:hypothetical protein
MRSLDNTELQNGMNEQCRLDWHLKCCSRKKEVIHILLGLRMKKKRRNRYLKYLDTNNCYSAIGFMCMMCMDVVCVKCI